MAQRAAQLYIKLITSIAYNLITSYCQYIFIYLSVYNNVLYNNALYNNENIIYNEIKFVN